MTFNETLKQYYKVKNQIRSIILKQQELRGLNAFPKTNDNCGSKPTEISRPAENFVCKLIELNNKQVELEESLLCLRNDLENYFEKISDYNIRTVCEQRIFLNTEWKKIASIIDKSYSYTTYLFNNGLKILRG